MGTRLENKTALVTGATSNIGRAIAIMFAAEGAHVVVSGRDQTRGAEVVAEIRAAGGRADFVPAELDGSRARVRGACSRGDSRARRAHRRARQQRRHLPWLVDGDDRRGNVRPGLRGQRQGTVLPDRRDRSGDGRARRRSDHQPRFLDRAPRHTDQLALQLDQGRDRDSDPGLGGRVRTGRRARQRHLARRRR